MVKRTYSIVRNGITSLGRKRGRKHKDATSHRGSSTNTETSGEDLLHLLHFDIGELF